MPHFSAIDPDRLDEEWAGQPKRYHTWAKRLANARKRVADREAELDVIRAECAKRIRKNPPKYGITRATDASVKSAVPTHPLYREALSSLNRAKHKRDVYEAAVKALEHRKSALGDLVYLWGQQYFAGRMKVRPGTEQSIRDRLDAESVKRSVTRKRNK